ncbi:hypothetical protein LY90DRAFT_425758 [Neocallimastix californiae]|uniref:Uncharacterized protein n=1 Tax=Neocallimastix californiae TaxID=1754190 RepID=A0A1Y2AZH2_9FUNG|nr:hypothetical protein LY90DRAFT_425758 [Neocallimastix californiae]|eukprot:ORY27962.1 hypothetical protein LY90DRAFT_425758 [Neocallimastix californiae]
MVVAGGPVQIKIASEALTSSKVETQTTIKLMDEQGEKIKTFMDSLTKSLKGLKEADDKRDEEIRTIKKDIENVKTLIPKMFEKSKETNNLVLRDLQDEIKSLKSLVLNRMTINEIDSSLSSRFPFLGQNPSIPAWQVSGASSNTEEKEKKKKKKRKRKCYK